MLAVCKDSFYNYVDCLWFVKDDVYTVHVLNKRVYVVIGPFGKPSEYNIRSFIKKFKPFKKGVTK